MKIPEIVYLLCAIMSFSCAFILVKGYLRDRTRLLLWSSLCFVALAANNALLFADIVLFPQTDLWGSLWRAALGAVAGIVLLYGLIWELT